MEIDVWSGDWGIPSIDYNSLQLVTLVKFSGAQAQVNKTNNPFKAPDGSLPVFKHNSTKLTKFQDVLGYLNAKNYCPDLNLNPVQLAESKAYRTMLEEKFLPALRYIWWVDNKNYTEFTRPWYAKALPFPLNFYYPNRYKQENERILRSLYPDMTEEEYEKEVFKEAEKCLNCLSNRLGDSHFFFGQYPCSLDAAVYGCLAPLLKAPFPSSLLQNHLKASTNLVKFIVRISQRYFPQDLSDYDAKRQKESESNSKQSDMFPNKVRNQILAGLFAAAAMLFYGMSEGIFSIDFSNVQNDGVAEYEDEENRD